MTDEELKVKEDKLKERLKSIAEMEAEIKKREKSLKEKEKSKKQILLRLSPSLWNEIAAWAETDFRSINGQVEYLLTECVRNHKKNQITDSYPASVLSLIAFTTHNK